MKFKNVIIELELPFKKYKFKFHKKEFYDKKLKTIIPSTKISTITLNAVDILDAKRKFYNICCSKGIEPYDDGYIYRIIYFVFDGTFNAFLSNNCPHFLY